MPIIGTAALLAVRHRCLLCVDLAGLSVNVPPQTLEAITSGWRVILAQSGTAPSIDKPFATRQELIPFYRSGKSQHRRQPVNVDTERQRNPASVRIPPPCSRNDSRDALDLFGLRLRRCNQLEIVKGGSRFRTPEHRKSTTD